MTLDLDREKKIARLLELMDVPDPVLPPADPVRACFEHYGLRPGKVAGARSGDLYRLYRDWFSVRFPEEPVASPAKFANTLWKYGFVAKTQERVVKGSRLKWRAFKMTWTSAQFMRKWIRENPPPDGFTEWYRAQFYTNRGSEDVKAAAAGKAGGEVAGGLSPVDREGSRQEGGMVERGAGGDAGRSGAGEKGA